MDRDDLSAFFVLLVICATVFVSGWATGALNVQKEVCKQLCTNTDDYIVCKRDINNIEMYLKQAKEGE